MTEPTLDTILRRVQGLLANADDPANTPEAADAYRTKADALMFKYQIDMAMADQAKPVAQRATPVWGEVIVGRADSEFATSYRVAVHYVARHVGVRVVIQYGDDYSTYVARFVGYEAEVRYAELLMTNVLLAFQRKLEPGVNRQLSDDANAYNLRHAGWEGGRIAEALWGVNDKASRSKARNAFARHARSLGEDPAPLLGKSSIKVYRETYAEAFTSELYYRLAAMARTRAEDERGLVLKDRAELIDEAFYERYPSLRPIPSDRALPTSTMHKDCPKCAKAKSGYCRDHGYLRPRASKPRAYSAAGHRAGADAARSVDLGQRGTRVTGGDRRAID